MPTWLATGHALPKSCSSVHCGEAVGLPISPGGSVTSMSLTFSSGGWLKGVPSSSASANLKNVRASNGCAPAWRFGVPSALNAPASNSVIWMAACACAANIPHRSKAAVSAIPASRARKRL